MMSRKKGKRSRKTPRKKSKQRRRFRGRNYHHVLKAKSLGGDNSHSNLLLIDIEKHACWHKMFKLLTIRQVIELLQRVERMKLRLK